MSHKTIFQGEKKKKSLDFSTLCPCVSFLLFLPGCIFTHFGEAFPILQLERTVQILLLSALSSIKDAQTGHACFSWAKSHIKHMGVLPWTDQAAYSQKKAEEKFEKVQLFVALQSEF